MLKRLLQRVAVAVLASLSITLIWAGIELAKRWLNP